MSKILVENCNLRQWCPLYTTACWQGRGQHHQTSATGEDRVCVCVWYAISCPNFKKNHRHVDFDRCRRQRSVSFTAVLFVFYLFGCFVFAFLTAQLVLVTNLWLASLLVAALWLASRSAAFTVWARSCIGVGGSRSHLGPGNTPPAGVAHLSQRHQRILLIVYNIHFAQEHVWEAVAVSLCRHSSKK